MPNSNFKIPITKMARSACLRTATVLTISLSSHSANAVIFDLKYTGNNFTDPYSFDRFGNRIYTESDSIFGDGPVTAHIVLDIPSLNRRNGSSYDDYVTSFSLTAGEVTLSFAHPGAGYDLYLPMDFRDRNELPTLLAWDARITRRDRFHFYEVSTSDYFSDHATHVGMTGSITVSNYDRPGVWTISSPGSPPVVPVPEPSSWALMLAGFGVLGGALRRRRGLLASIRLSIGGEGRV